jgi:hypothetical protein
MQNANVNTNIKEKTYILSNIAGAYTRATLLVHIKSEKCK